MFCEAASTKSQLSMPAGSFLYHLSEYPDGLVRTGFDPDMAHDGYYGSFFFTDRPASATNCAIHLPTGLTLANRQDLSQQLGISEYDMPKPAQVEKLDIDGTYEHVVADPCTDAPGDSRTLEIIIFQRNLHKLGELSLFETPAWEGPWQAQRRLQGLYGRDPSSLAR